MTKGFLIGAFWGVLVGGLILIVSALVLETRAIRPLIPGADPVAQRDYGGFAVATLSDRPIAEQVKTPGTAPVRSLWPRLAQVSLPVPANVPATPQPSMAHAKGKYSVAASVSAGPFVPKPAGILAANLVAPLPDSSVRRATAPGSPFARQESVATTRVPDGPAPPKPIIALLTRLMSVDPVLPPETSIPGLSLGQSFDERPGHVPGQLSPQVKVAERVALQMPPAPATGPDIASDWAISAFRAPVFNAQVPESLPVTKTSQPVRTQASSLSEVSIPVLAVDIDGPAVLADYATPSTHSKVAFVLVPDQASQAVNIPDWARTVLLSDASQGQWSGLADGVEVAVELPDSPAAILTNGTPQHGANLLSKTVAARVDGQVTLVDAMRASGVSGFLALDRTQPDTVLAAQLGGLPAALVYDVLEADDDLRLAGLAERARRDGQAVVLVPARPGILTAITDWLRDGSGQQIAPVPLSAVLR